MESEVRHALRAEPTRDELLRRCEELQRIVDAIPNRKELEGRLLQAQKLESIGRLAGGVAHDFNNLLTSIFGLIALAQRAVPTESMAHEYLALLRLAAEGGANLTKQLLAFARRQIIEPRLVDLNALVLDAAQLLERVLGETIEVVVELCSQRLPVKVDPNQFSQLLLNLALNARDAMSGGGRLVFRSGLSLTAPESCAGRYATLAVIDTGGGLSDEALEHLFEPFFTTKSLGQGTGLGLAMCYGIVKQNGGQIAVESTTGVGTTFTIYLPEVDAEVEPTRQRPSVPVEVGRETVLFVEDDDLLRHLTVPELARHGYRLIEAANGEEALKAAVEHTGPIHLLITDVIMPQMGGIELARRFEKLRPAVPILFISGYTNEEIDVGESLPNLLLKPFTSDALLVRVRQLLDARQRQPEL